MTVLGSAALAKPSPLAEGLAPQIYRRGKKFYDRSAAWLRLIDDYRLDDQRRGAPTLVCLLVGSKPELWNYVLPRFASALPEADVCLVTPGLARQDIRDHCRGNGWSYLSTATNDVCLALNVCYKLHPNAAMIVKIDEDMFLLPDTITNILKQYHAIKQEGIVNPGFVAPMIPLNGLSYRALLELLGLLEEYEERFGTAHIAHTALPVHRDIEVAVWMWEHTAPLAVTAERLARLDAFDVSCSVRFNMGMVVFERAFWELIGYLPVHRSRLIMGLCNHDADEAHICSQAIAFSRPGIVTPAGLAGHFAFPEQYDAMLSVLESKSHLFAG